MTTRLFTFIFGAITATCLIYGLVAMQAIDSLNKHIKTRNEIILQQHWEIIKLRSKSNGCGQVWELPRGSQERI